jgi:hypothetical protein
LTLAQILEFSATVMKTTLILVLCFIAVRGCQSENRNVAAPHSGERIMEEYFTGRFIAVKVALATSHLVLISQVTNPGVADAGAPGQAYFDKASIRVVKLLKGETKEKELAIAYTCQKLPESSAEKEPETGGTFIFFLELRKDRTLKAIKILRATDDNVEQVTEALEDQPG